MGEVEGDKEGPLVGVAEGLPVDGEKLGLTDGAVVGDLAFRALPFVQVCDVGMRPLHRGGWFNARSGGPVL